MQLIPGRFEVNMKKSYDKDTEIELLLQLIYDLCNSKAGITVTSENRWYVDAESVIAKIFNHLSTIHYLFKGTFFKLPKNNKTQHFFDHSSISTIARVAIETYLTLYYLFIHNCSDLERNFRYAMWELGGLYNRQQYYQFSNATIQKQVEESDQVRDLRKNITQNPLFEHLSKGLKKKALKGEWRLSNSWSDIAEIAGFDIAVFKTMYNHLSSFSHTDSLSIYQIKQAINTNDQQMLCEMPKNISLILLSHLAKSFEKIFPEAKHLIDKSEEIRLLVEKHYISFKEFEQMKKS